VTLASSITTFIAIWDCAAKVGQTRMDSAAYAIEAAIEADHWWFVGRRLLFSDLINGFGLPRDAEILDVGT
jgi:hypothetical protein